VMRSLYNRRAIIGISSSELDLSERVLNRVVHKMGVYFSLLCMCFLTGARGFCDLDIHTIWVKRKGRADWRCFLIFVPVCLFLFPHGVEREEGERFGSVT